MARRTVARSALAAQFVSSSARTTMIAPKNSQGTRFTLQLSVRRSSWPSLTAQAIAHGARRASSAGEQTRQPQRVAALACAMIRQRLAPAGGEDRHRAQQVAELARATFVE